LTVRMAIETAVQEAAPETTGIEVEGVVTEQQLIQIGRRHEYQDVACTVPAAGVP
jgi:flavin-binding protein dodecin